MAGGKVEVVNPNKLSAVTADLTASRVIATEVRVTGYYILWVIFQPTHGPTPPQLHEPFALSEGGGHHQRQRYHRRWSRRSFQRVQVGVFFFWILKFHSFQRHIWRCDSGECGDSRSLHQPGLFSSASGCPQQRTLFLSHTKKHALNSPAARCRKQG